MIQVNPRYVRGKPMLRSSELREACKYCVKLHNYYIHNYKMCDDIMVQYKEHHFLVRDDIFVVSFSDLYDLFSSFHSSLIALLKSGICLISRSFIHFLTLKLHPIGDKKEVRHRYFRRIKQV
jgi:hypothetical protein